MVLVSVSLRLHGADVSGCCGRRPPPLGSDSRLCLGVASPLTPCPLQQTPPHRPALGLSLFMSDPSSKSLSQWMATFLRLVWVRMFIFSHLSDNSDFTKLPFKAFFFSCFKPLRGLPGGTMDKHPPADGGTRVCSLVRENASCHGAAKSVRYSCWACVLEPETHYWSARTPEPMLPNQRSPCRDGATDRDWSRPPFLSAARENRSTAVKTQHSRK